MKRMSDTKKQPKTPKPNIQPIGYSIQKKIDNKVSDEVKEQMAEMSEKINKIIRRNKEMVKIKHNDDNGELILSTEKKINAYCGYIGINKAGDISSGYDEQVYSENWDNGNDEYELTESELIEIADYMISVWNEFKRKQESK